MISPWSRPPFVEGGPGFLDGVDSPRAYLERCIERIEARESEVRAFVRLDLAAARRAADAATQRWRERRPRSPLDGMPLGVKDIIETRDFPTEMGSPVFAGWQSGRDAACVHALREAGAIIVGKTVTTEFAVGAAGATRNPLDPARTPAGSSSGSAAAVSAGMLPVALGTQTQSSTLRPASFCGVYGFKPTFGALHLGGVHPLAPSHDHLGIIAGSLADLWACACVIGPQLANEAVLPPARKPVCVAWLKTAGWTELDHDIRERFGQWLDQLASRGVAVVGEGQDRDLSELEVQLHGADQASEDILAYEMRWPFEAYAASALDKLGTRLRELIERGRRMSAADYGERVRYREGLRESLRHMRDRFDALVSLAASGIAPRGLENTGARSFPIPGSLMGAPSFSVPLLEHAGMPLGVQVMGYPDADTDAVRIARWLAEPNRVVIAAGRIVAAHLNPA